MGSRHYGAWGPAYLENSVKRQKPEGAIVRKLLVRLTAAVVVAAAVAGPLAACNRQQPEAPSEVVTLDSLRTNHRTGTWYVAGRAFGYKDDYRPGGLNLLSLPPDTQVLPTELAGADVRIRYTNRDNPQTQTGIYEVSLEDMCHYDTDHNWDPQATRPTGPNGVDVVFVRFDPQKHVDLTTCSSLINPTQIRI
jgi:hypothetical protein